MSDIAPYVLAAVCFGTLFLATRTQKKTRALLDTVSERIAENQRIIDEIEAWNRRHQEQDTPSEFERCMNK